MSINREEIEAAVRQYIAMAEKAKIRRAKRAAEIVRRWVDVQDVDTVRQHLADRHGVPIALAEGLPSLTAYRIHEEHIDHSGLGHTHAKKSQRAGKP
jgi:hypothetical protein